MSKEPARDYLLQAEALYENGHITDAIALYKKALSLNQGLIEASINLSIALCQMERPEEALAYIQDAIDRAPNDAPLLNTYGNILRQLGRPEEAIRSYKNALVTDPQSVQIRFNLASALQETQRIDEAIEQYSVILDIDPYHKRALYNISVAFNYKGQYEEALSYLNRCLKIDPKDASTINLIALVFEATGSYVSAEGCFRRAIHLKPEDYSYHFNYANFLSRQGRPEEAVRQYRKATSLNNHFKEGFLQLGNHLRKLKQYDEALKAYYRVIEIDPDSADGYNNIGNTYKDLGIHSEALRYMTMALRINPKQAGYYFNLGLIYKEMFRYREAIDSYRAAINLNEDYAEAHWNLALLLLMHGEFKEGWREYEWRKRLNLYAPYKRDFDRSQWAGEDISGKTILIYDEQGFGDAIQFIRYAPMLKKIGARVIVECLSPLTRLFEGAAGVDKVITRGFQLPDFDYHCSILSLPMMFGTDLYNIPAKTPYLKVSELLIDEWAKKVSPFRGSFNVGIAWGGINPPHKSCHLNKLIPLLELGHVQFFSLQVGPAREDLSGLTEGLKVIDLMGESRDFADTAALMMNLDLVITIDTSIAHLSGALARPVWVMLHYDADWRWLLDREDSPWYPTMRLFRQSEPGNWNSLINNIRLQCDRTNFES